jgi:hypothetical protein
MFSKHRALAALPPMARVPTTYPAATQSVAVDARRALTLTAASAVLTAFPPRALDAANPLDTVVGGGARRHARDADADVDTDARDADRAVANDDDAIVVIVADAAHLATLRIAMDDGECRRARSSRRNGASAPRSLECDGADKAHVERVRARRGAVLRTRRLITLLITQQS